MNLSAQSAVRGTRCQAPGARDLVHLGCNGAPKSKLEANGACVRGPAIVDRAVIGSLVPTISIARRPRCAVSRRPKWQRRGIPR